MIISIDFDDTIVYSGSYPEILKLKPNAKEVINKFYDDGNEIIINTCRRDEFEKMAKDFLIKNGINFHHINENLPRLIDEYQEDTRKLFADLYIDDKNLGGIPDDWLTIDAMVRSHRLYPENNYGNDVIVKIRDILLENNNLTDELEELLEDIQILYRAQSNALKQYKLR